MRNFKKVAAMVMVFVFAMSSVSFAAIGSKKFSAPKKPRVSTQQKAKPAETKPSNDYKPSQNAKSLDKNAPAAGAKSNAASAPKPQGSMMGNMMRNIGLLAGGMMLGSLLSGMFGMGEGLFADILGMAVNVIIFMAIFMLGRMLWNKFKNRNKKKEEDNIYRMRR